MCGGERPIPAQQQQQQSSHQDTSKWAGFARTSNNANNDHHHNRRRDRRHKPSTKNTRGRMKLQHHVTPSTISTTPSTTTSTTPTPTTPSLLHRRPFSLDYLTEHGPYHRHKKSTPPPAITTSTASLLLVAEKPSIASSIARILNPHSSTAPPPSRGTTPIHEFNATFRSHECFFRVTSVTGHVKKLDFAPGFENRADVDPASLFQAPTRKMASDSKSHMQSHLRRCAHGMDFLVLWLDCDREGENICFEVMEAVQGAMNRHHSAHQIYRARFSSITPGDIHQAMNNLDVPHAEQALAVEARMELDLRMGVAFTRFQSRLFQSKYGNLKSRLISFGPCQTPTLQFCVERHDQIETFVPETYWVVSVSTPNFPLEWARKRVFDKDVGMYFYRLVSQRNSAVITSVTSRRKLKPRPTPLNTVELLKVASKQLGIGPGDTMHIAESLYIQGYISYPRTETTAYPARFDFEYIMREHANQPSWGAHVQQLLYSGITAPKRGNDAGDHPPITPMRAAQPGELGSNTWCIYDYICRHFFATISPDCEYMQTTLTCEMGGEEFSAHANQVTSAGFTSLMHWMTNSFDDLSSSTSVSLADLKQGDRLSVSKVELAERKTSAPGYLSESELISAMEKHGIGTDASISTHISNICNRNYVTLDSSSRTLRPNNLGTSLCHGYYKIDPELSLPQMRSYVEQQFDLIADGKADYYEVLQHSVHIFAAKYAYFVEHINKMDELFEQHFSPLEQTHGRLLSRCGKCNKWLKYIPIKPARLYCSSCDDTYNLPQNGKIGLYQERKCPLDGFELVLYSTGGVNGIMYPLCPMCYNHPPFSSSSLAPDSDNKNNKKMLVMACNNCPNPACKFSLVANGVAPCNEHETCGGTLVFESSTRPVWRLACNSCNFILHFAEKAHKVRVLNDRRCGECSAKLLEIEFHKDRRPTNAREPHRGCLFCDPVLSNTTSEAFGNLRKKRNFKRGRRGRRKLTNYERLMRHNG
jgi:DNA topoisomerase III